MIEKSGFGKRLYKRQLLPMWLFEETGRLFNYICAEMEDIIDSFPRKVCYNIRISRSKLFRGVSRSGDIMPANVNISMV